MSKSQLDTLDGVAIRVAKDDLTTFGVLSTGERLYVALAANRADLLDQLGYTVAEAIARLGQDWTNELIARWQYRGNPRKYE